MGDKNKRDEIKKETRKVIILALLISFGVWLVGAVVTRAIGVHCFPCKDGDSAAAGLFGDSFGAVNALVSAFAFAGVIASFWLQREEFKLQREDLKLQYDELHAQREEFTQQNMTLKLQRFENTFFNMMELQQQIVNDLHLQVPQNIYVQRKMLGEFPSLQTKDINGREVIRYIYDQARGTLSDQGLSQYAKIDSRELLDHYFRHLYTILRFVDTTDAFKTRSGKKQRKQIEWEQRYHYTTILRATLSRYEMLILYYNGLSEFGREKLKPLIEKYALLDNIDIRNLTISRENSMMIGMEATLYGFGLDAYQLSGTDYEFYLTEKENDPSKYNIHAFGHGEENMEKARLAVANFQKMLKEKAVERVG